jgi:hypothetical protein
MNNIQRRAGNMEEIQLLRSFGEGQGRIAILVAEQIKDKNLVNPL